MGLQKTHIASSSGILCDREKIPSVNRDEVYASRSCDKAVRARDVSKIMPVVRRRLREC